jgi:hypothetical protein
VIDQQKQLYQPQRALPETSSSKFFSSLQLSSLAPTLILQLCAFMLDYNIFI